MIKKGIFVMIIALGIIALIILGTHFLLASNFQRGGYADYPEVDFYYDHYKDKYSREEFNFYSGKNKLQGFIYGAKNNKLLIWCHGLGAAHESYIQEILYFVDNGYRVISYDATGSGESEGKSTVGLIQSAIDLDHCFKYIESNDELKSLPIYLIGHSWGGFAVAEAAGRHENIKAIASISGYAYPVEMIVKEGSRMFEFNLKSFSFLFEISHMISFGIENYKRNAVDSINSTDTPILLIHGNKDEMIPLDDCSIVSKMKDTKNPNVHTLIVSDEGQNGHNSIFYNKEAVGAIEEFNRQFDDEIKNIPAHLQEVKREKEIILIRERLIDKADLELINKVNDDLLDKIINFFNEA